MWTILSNMPNQARSEVTDILESYLSVDEVARILRKSRKTVYRYVAAGLPSRKIGNAHLIRKDELFAWIEERKVRPVSPFRRMPPGKRGPW